MRSWNKFRMTFVNSRWREHFFLQLAGDNRSIAFNYTWLYGNPQKCKFSRTTFRERLLCKSRNYIIECDGWDRVLRWSIDEPIWVDEVDETIRSGIIETHDAELFEKNTRALIPDLFWFSYRFHEADLPCLSAGNRGITRIGSESETSGNPSSTSTTVETGNSCDFRIRHTANFDLVIGSYEFECCINGSYGVWITDRLLFSWDSDWSVIWGRATSDESDW